MRNSHPIDADKHIADFWVEVGLIRTFQEIYDRTDPVGRRARKIRLAQIARELRRMRETVAVSGGRARKPD